MSEIFKQARKSADYLIEENRRKTFKKWVFSNNDACNADKLAEAGFIYIGNRNEPDAVKCFFCGKSLDGWDPTDDPWEEHLKHSPNCSFAKLQKPQDSQTLMQFIDIKNELMENVIKTYFENKAKVIIDRFEDYENKIKLQLVKE